MSRAVASVVLQRRFGSTVRKAVALVLADHADGDRWATVVGQARISREAEIGERTVRRVLGDLEAEGLIVRSRRHRSDGTRTSDEIVLVRSAIEALPATDAASTTGHTGRLEGETTGQRVQNLPATQARPTGQSLAAQEPSVEPSDRTPSLRSGQLPATDAGRRDEVFETIVWVSYGIEWTPHVTVVTSRERGMANRAAKELRAVGATPEEIIRRSRHFYAWVGQRPTPDNLVSHWNRLNEPQQRATKAQLAQLERELGRQRRRKEILDGP